MPPGTGEAKGVRLPFDYYIAYFTREHLQVDSLAGVAHHRNGIDGAQWLTQSGQKSDVECKGKSQLNWDHNKTDPSRETVA